MEAFEEKHKGKVKVTKVDVYKSKGLAERLHVSEVPTVVYIKDKAIQNTLTGEITIEKIEALL